MLMLSDGEHLLFGEATKRHAVLKGNHTQIVLWVRRASKRYGKGIFNLAALEQSNEEALAEMVGEPVDIQAWQDGGTTLAGALLSRSCFPMGSRLSRKATALARMRCLFF